MRQWIVSKSSKFWRKRKLTFDNTTWLHALSCLRCQSLPLTHHSRSGDAVMSKTNYHKKSTGKEVDVDSINNPAHFRLKFGAKFLCMSGLSLELSKFFCMCDLLTWTLNVPMTCQSFHLCNNLNFQHSYDMSVLFTWTFNILMICQSFSLELLTFLWHVIPFYLNF